MPAAVRFVKISNKVKADENFDANKLEWKLQLAIQQLPEKQRVVFTLRYYDEMPHEEMSRVLETSEGALKASYHHAVKKIEDYIMCVCVASCISYEWMQAGPRGLLEKQLLSRMFVFSFPFFVFFPRLSDSICICVCLCVCDA